MNVFRRAARALWREAIARTLPHGLLGVGYVRRRPSSAVALHRALWRDALPGWPRWLVALVEANLWLRWTMFGAWRATWRMVCWHGANVQATEGLTRSRQARRVLGLALRWCVPPAQAYQFGLYRAPPRGEPDPALGYVYSTELAAWHRHVNAQDAGRDAAIALLRDKPALAQRLAAAGVPVADTLAIIRAGAPGNLAEWLDTHPRITEVAESGLFFKLRDGMGARGAFAAWRRDGAWEARTLHGDDIRRGEGLQALWRTLSAQGEVLVQPRLVAHPGLAALAGVDDPVTVRVITRRVHGSATVEVATLEVPLGRKGLHVLWLITTEHGEVQTVGWDGRPASQVPPTDPVFPMIRTPGPGLLVPDWARLEAESRRAHDSVGALAWIAWDWIVTPDGPLLLEGNSGWGPVSPQRLYGPLLTR